MRTVQPSTPAGRTTVAFVVIAYNEAGNIGRCLASIRAQEADDIAEVVVVDDCSTDATAEVVEGAARADPRIRLIRHEVNRGRGAARRTGQDAVRSPFVAFIDGDIRLPPSWLQQALEAIRDADAVSGVAVPDGDCAVLWRVFGPRPRAVPSTWPLTGNNALIRSRALEQVGWSAERRRAEDNHMAVALVEHGFTVRTDRALTAEHHETKSYRRTLAHTWGTGYHTVEVLRDLRRIRLPDVAWACWLLCLVVAAVLGAAGLVSPIVAVAIAVGVTLAVDVLAMLQRFHVWPNPLRFCGAVVGNLPLLTAYLTARTVFAWKLVTPRAQL